MLENPMQLNDKIFMKGESAGHSSSKGPGNGLLSPEGNFFTRGMSGFCEARRSTS